MIFCWEVGSIEMLSFRKRGDIMSFERLKRVVLDVGLVLVYLDVISGFFFLRSRGGIF